MRPVRFRQIARLEKLAQPLLQRKGDEDRRWKLTVWGAVHHAAVLAFLTRYGDPRVDEPLSSACERCAASTAWNECRQEFGWFLQDPSGENVFHPHTRDAVTRMGDPLRHFVIESFPGKDEKEKLNTVFTSAPPWLLWFTFADYTAKLLDLTLPDLSSVSCFVRSKKDFDIWWGLPTGAFERELWPRGQQEEPLARTDLNLLRPTIRNSVRAMTRREQMRQHIALEQSNRHEYQRQWPDLLPAQVLKLSRSEFLSLNEQVNHRNRDFHHATIGRPSPRFR
jgi:hypothetical protein